MFTSWQASPGPSSTPPASRNSPKSRRQSSTTHACEECRRRKIRCDGKLPCSHCEWYKHPKLCRYAKKQPRVVPSQRLLADLSDSLARAQKVLGQLFPDADVGRLGALPRHELVDLIHAANAKTPSSGVGGGASPPVPQAEPAPFAPAAPSLERNRSEADESRSTLEALEPEPEPDANWDEAEKFDAPGLPAVSDDVNALNMSVRSASSYLGVSSIAAALRVMSKINKPLGHVILGNAGQTDEDSDAASSLSTSADSPTTIAQPTLSEPSLIDAYFDQVHPLIPMVDEKRFRQIYQTGTRKDKSWLALLYMVLAMGTIAASTAEDNSHLLFYDRARSLMGLDILGNGHIEALQALGLMGGLYLHYQSRPNMANAVMGAALRMACALGLHREYAEGAPAEARPDFVRQATLIPREVRRRTWWSLFCLDTWATTTQGRPSLGRIGPAVTVLPPAFLGAPPDLADPAACAADDALVLVLCQETAFCKIATRIQDRLAEAPLLPYDETARFDAELRAWRAALPPLFRPDRPCPARARLPRAVMSWRYHNLRLVLHRPVLLNHALRSSLEPPAPLAREGARLVAACRAIAAENIADIRAHWTRAQMSGWNAVWLLFQACMPPLVTVFAELNRRDHAAVRAAQAQLADALALLADMADWSVAAKKTLVFVRKMYDRSRQMLAQAEAQQKGGQGGLEAAMANLATEAETAPAPGPLTTAAMGFPPDGGGYRPLEPVADERHAFAEAAQPVQDPSLYGQPALVSSHGEMPAVYPVPPLGTAPPDPHYYTPSMVPQQHAMSLPPALQAPPAPGYYGLEHTSYMNQEEFQAFWNQILWGEGEMPDVMMDTTTTTGTDDLMQYPTTSGSMDYGYGAYGS